MILRFVTKTSNDTSNVFYVSGYTGRGLKKGTNCADCHVLLSAETGEDANVKFVLEELHEATDEERIARESFIDQVNKFHFT